MPWATLHSSSTQFNSSSWHVWHADGSGKKYTFKVGIRQKKISSGKLITRTILSTELFFFFTFFFPLVSPSPPIQVDLGCVLPRSFRKKKRETKSAFQQGWAGRVTTARYTEENTRFTFPHSEGAMCITQWSNSWLTESWYPSSSTSWNSLRVEYPTGDSTKEQ